MSIEIRILTDLNDSSINDYYNRFHNENRSKEAFDWEFIDTPFSQAIYIHAFDEDNKIIGAISVLFLELINGSGDKILSGKPEDVMVDIFSSVKYRKVDIFKSLYEALEKECIKKGVSLLWGFTYADSSFKRMGFESSFTSNNGIFVLKPLNSYKYLVSLNRENKSVDKIKIAILTCLSLLNGSKVWFTSAKILGQVIDDDLSGHNALVTSHFAGTADLFNLSQDEEFLNWRLHENPNKLIYKSLSLLDEDKKHVAEIIYSVSGKIAYIEQILYDKSLKERQVIRFIKNAITKIRKSNVSIIRFMGFNGNISNAKEMKFLGRLGFVFSNKGIPFVFKDISDNPADIKSKSIFLSRLFTQGNL